VDVCCKSSCPSPLQLADFSSAGARAVLKLATKWAAAAGGGGVTGDAGAGAGRDGFVLHAFHPKQLKQRQVVLH
jgi:hypothetical protein